MKRFSVHDGSTTDRTVGGDAIVNAGNPYLGLGSGVSVTIREACGGAAFQQLVREALSTSSSMPLLGAGHGGLGVVASTRAVFTGIATALERGTASGAQRVSVRFAVPDVRAANVLFDEDWIAPFRL
ncbi:MAG: hypothetical protein H6716_24040 [Polyangiaceae bacterium]|nr:hypothetical protein [Polyangiaceae bacterium]